MSDTETLCRAVLEVQSASLPADVVTAAHRVLLDGVAVALAGCDQSGPRLLSEHAQEQGGSPVATTIGHGFKTSTFWATYLNGTSMHVLDYEPMSSPATHATSTCLPAVLALAEALGASGRECITALVKGVEMQGRIRIAGVAHDTPDNVFHHPGVVGVMGAAVAAGHLLGLNVEQLCNALGIAASRAGCVTANAGTMTKATHCGLAAATGLDAALLAKRGFTGCPDVFDHRNGFVPAFFGQDWEPSALLAFGRPYRMVDPGYAIKLFPSKYTTHWGITAALALRDQLGDPAQIESVRIATPNYPDVDRPEPPTGLAGKFSFQYTVACALLDGRIAIDSFSDERRFREDMTGLLPRIKVVVDPAIPPAFEAMWVEVSVRLEDGREVTEKCLKPKGHYALPLITDEEHLVKVRDCLTAMLAPEAVERCIDWARGFFDLPPADVSAFMALLGRGAEPARRAAG